MEETGGIPKPGGTVNPGVAAAPPEAGGGGLGELAAKTLPILSERNKVREQVSDWVENKRECLAVGAIEY